MEWKLPRRMRWRVRAEKNVYRIGPGARCRREVERPAWMPGESGLHLRMLVGGVVVDDSLDDPAGWHRPLDGIEEADELLMPVALHAAADHGAFRHIQCREQRRRRAMALVVMCHGAAATGLERQPRLRAVERLDLALLVESEPTL